MISVWSPVKQRAWSSPCAIAGAARTQPITRAERKRVIRAFGPVARCLGPHGNERWSTTARLAAGAGSRVAAAVADDGARRARAGHRIRIHRPDRPARGLAVGSRGRGLPRAARPLQRKEPPAPPQIPALHRHGRNLRFDAVLLLACDRGPGARRRTVPARALL